MRRKILSGPLGPLVSLVAPVVVSVSLSAGCAARTQGLPGEVLIVTPMEGALVAEGQGGATLQFRAKTQEGADVTASASWSTNDGALGAISRGLFATPDGLARGGYVKVRAEHEGRTGEALLRVQFVAPDQVSSGAPEDSADHFGGGIGGAPPAPVYPLHNAMLARNINQMRIAWQGDPSHKLHRVAFESPTYKQRFFVGSAACPGQKCSLRISDDDWTALTKSNAGTQLQMAITSTSGKGEALGRGPQVTLHISPEDVRGGLYYFSTSQYGLMRLPFGSTRPVKFLLGTGKDTDVVDRCVGCHAVSRDGRKVAAVFGGGDGFGGIVDGTDPTKFLLKPIAPTFGEVPPYKGQLWNFASFSPKGDQLIGVFKGDLTLRSGENGALLSKLSRSLYGGGRAAMPEWSPDGKWIVFVRVTSPEGRLGVDIAKRDPRTNELLVQAGDWILADAGDIAMIPYNDGNFGEAITVVAHEPGKEYHFYPSFSPDSRWIVFNSMRKGQCGSPSAERNGVDVTGRCMTYDQTGARLRLVRAGEDQTPIELLAATQAPNKTTAWPKFAPFQQAGGKLVFVTYSAKFNYGWVIQQDLIKAATGAERPQLWMSAIDLSKAEKGEADPSYAPFWLPFQDATNNNHEAIWTTDIACRVNADCGSEFECAAGVCVPRLG